MTQGKILDIIICGGGLGGLGCALALQQNGHSVTILEGASNISEVGAGIQVPPNSVRLLEKYKLTSKMKQVVCQPKGIVLRRYANGEPLSTTALDPEMTERYGYPYWLIHRADYLKILYEAALERGIKVFTNSRVKRVDDDTATVYLENGKEYSGDLIIGADGIKLAVRDTCVVPDIKVEPIPSGYCAYRATIPGDVMRKDPKISHLITEVDSNNWIGYQRHVMAYPMRNGESYNVVMIYPGEAAVGKWHIPGDLEEMKAEYKDFDPVLKQVLSHVDECLLWVLAEVECPRWVSEGGRVCLIGDAAHAMLPFLSQGAAQALEDGATLAEELKKLNTLDDLPSILKKYESLRKPRVTDVQKGARVHSVIWHYPDGPEQEERDRKMKATISDTPDTWSRPSSQKWLFGWDAFTSTY